MPITLNHSNISVQYSSDKSYIIETVKSDLYLRDSRIGISSNLTAEPVVIAPAFTETIRTFAHSGGTEDQTTHTITIGQNTICDILIVGGGGGGGFHTGGGGGAGGYYYQTNITIPAGTYTINVGKGGIAGPDNNTRGGNGSDTAFYGITAKGGGGGASDNAPSGNSGGSGGGADWNGTAGLDTDTNTEGNNGGTPINITGQYYGSGGGGAGSTGFTNGNGGTGKSNSITGTNTFYAAGGGGGRNEGTNWSGIGGSSIGGNGGNGTTAGTAGLNGTGSGGGGGGFLTGGSAGKGGSGIVIIKFKSIVGAGILDNTTHKRLNFVYNSDNLVAWYMFNGDYLDSSGNGHNLTNVGTVIQSTQIIEGQAVEFDSTDYLEFPATINPYTIWNGKGITFSCWVRFTAHETWARILDFQSAVNTSTGFYIAVKANWSGIPSAIHMNIAEVTTFSYSNWSNSVLTNLGVWHHIVWSIDANGKWDVYLNNVRINNTETRAIPNITYNVRYINKSAFSGDGTWDGQMDDFRIYDRALSATDVAMLYNKTYPIPNNLYTLNFPVPTIADINNNSNIVLRGAYDIALSTTNAVIIPKSNQYIPKPTTFSTSNISLRYNLLNPILDPIGAQWTYSSNNTNVYHLGNVGIGTTTPEYTLDVRGAIYSSTGGYTSSTLTKWSVLSDRRIKENIVKASYDKCLENVKNIELYNFNFKDNCVNTNDRHQLGFIAQEVQQVYPKAVEVSNMIVNLEQKIDDLLTLNITQIDYTLYGAVKSLIEKIENIKIKMERIKTTYSIP